MRKLASLSTLLLPACSLLFHPGEALDQDAAAGIADAYGEDGAPGSDASRCGWTPVPKYFDACALPDSNGSVTLLTENSNPTDLEWMSSVVIPSETNAPARTIYVFDNLIIGPGVTLSLVAGPAATILVARDSMKIQGTVYVGAHEVDPGLCGASQGTDGTSGAGGGGGAFGSAGGAGGSDGGADGVAGASGGEALVGEPPTFLRGGCAGGGNAVIGGARGGGAVVFASPNPIVFSGTVDAGGRGGSGGSGVVQGGAGGGSGGMIVFETPELQATDGAIIVANGGGGGEGGVSSGSGNSGSNGSLEVIGAAGGAGQPTSGDGGQGAARTPTAGEDGEDGVADDNPGGGGGGGVGFIVLRAQPSPSTAIFSPAPDVVP